MRRSISESAAASTIVAACTAKNHLLSHISMDRKRHPAYE
jgi:hypothetical protein